MLVSFCLLSSTLLLLIHIGCIWSILFKLKYTTIEKLYFIGLIVTSSTAAILSLIFPLNFYLACFLFVALGILSILNRKKIRDCYQNAFVSFLKEKSVVFIVVIFSLFTYALTAKITLYDTGLYHTQAIKWIQEYAAVPGLGNLHGRFAFNSHFFVLSALFAFEFKMGTEAIIVYPINAAALLMLVIYLFNLGKKHFSNRNYLLGITYFVIISMCLLLYTFWVNSPSPDIISAVLVLYSVVFFIELKGNYSIGNSVLLAALIFTAIVFKLSNTFLALLVLAILVSYYNHKIRGLKKLFFSTLVLAILIIGPFLARNIVLSGYLVYPLAKVDLFDVDWKIPVSIVEEESLHIHTWAKIPRRDDAEVSQMKIHEWIPIWWQKKSMPFKMLIAGNLLSVIASILLIKKKRKTEIIVISIIWLNLLFWFFSAPDPRFAHGFLIFGVALTLGTFVDELLNKVSFKKGIFQKVFVASVASTLILSIYTVREKALDMFSNNLIYPKIMAKNSLAHFEAPFQHSVPKGNNRCYNAELPCLPSGTKKVEMRSNNKYDGYRSIINYNE